MNSISITVRLPCHLNSVNPCDFIRPVSHLCVNMLVRPVHG